VRVNLEIDGFAVREAGSADEGLAALEAEPPDLILLDVMMPRVDGWEMLQRVRERHGVDSIQVIMFSGQVNDNATDQAEASGAQAFLGKPFNPQELVTRAKDLLGS
jgi:DNA-binding response OmpR family regulator